MDTQVSKDALMGTFNFNNMTVDLDRIPFDVQVAMIKRTIQHKLGNEVAAAVIKLREKAGKTEEDFAEEAETETQRLREEMVNKIYEGTIGLRIGGPRGSTIENIAWELAMKQAEASLAPKGYWPKADRKLGIKAEDATVEFAGKAMTREELTQVVYDKYEAKFLEEAKVEHAKRMEKAKVAKANQVPVVKSVDQSAEDLLASIL